MTKDIDMFLPPDAAEHQVDSRDWLLDGASDMMERLRAYAPTSDYQYEWNQRSRSETRNFCTAVGPMCAILSYKQKSRGEQEWLDFWHYASQTYGYKSDSGHYMHVGIKCAVNYWNMHHPDDPLVYFNPGWNTEEFHEALAMGYRLVIGGKFNRTYLKDYISDGIVDDPKSWKNTLPTYGHIRTIVKKPNGLFHIDNYAGRNMNTFEVDASLLDEMMRSGAYCGYYPSAYVITSGKTITKERIPFDLAKKIQSMMTISSAMRNAIHDSNAIDPSDKEKAQNILHTFNQSWRDQFDF